MKLIDKDALVAEIERLENQNCKNSNDFNLGAATYLGILKKSIDTIEVKEVDLMMHTIITEGCDWLTLHTKLNHKEIEDCRNLMLTIKDEQLKAQKGE